MGTAWRLELPPATATCPAGVLDLCPVRPPQRTVRPADRYDGAPAGEPDVTPAWWPASPGRPTGWGTIMAPRFDRVFIITYGRSGSTLLQGLLNALPGFRIYGENARFLLKLQEAYEALLDANRHLSNPDRDDESQPWFGSSRYDEATVTLNFRQFVNRILFQPHLDPEHSVFGFKEIGFNELDSGRIERYIGFIRQLFPRSAIVFNTRRVDDVLKSGWWKRSYWPGLPKQLEGFADFADSYAAANADHAIHVRYDALILRDRCEVGRLLGFLQTQLSAAEIEAVFAAAHSYENRTLTAYLAGSADHIELLAPNWWKANVHEFEIRVVAHKGGLRLFGALAPASGADVRISLESGDCRVRLPTPDAPPKADGAGASEPGAAEARYDLWLPSSDVVQLYAQTASGAEQLIGLLHAERAIEARRERELRR